MGPECKEPVLTPCPGRGGWAGEEGGGEASEVMEGPGVVFWAEGGGGGRAEPETEKGSDKR